MYFAVDPPLRNSLVDRALIAMHGAKEQASSWFALVDLAFEDERSPFRCPGARWPLYCRPPLDELNRVSPTLIALVGDAHERRRQVASMIWDCAAKPMLGFVATRLEPGQLVDAWQACLYPSTEDGQRLLLRFADSRVAEMLPKALSPENWSLLTRGLDQWCVVDRGGDWLSLQLPPGKPVPAPAETGGLRLCDRELTRLLRLSQPDAVIEAMRELDPQLLPEADRRSFHAGIGRVCDFADGYGVEAFPDVLALCVAAALDPAVLQQERLLRTLSNRSWVFGRLDETLADLVAGALP